MVAPGSFMYLDEEQKILFNFRVSPSHHDLLLKLLADLDTKKGVLESSSRGMRTRFYRG